MPGGLSMPHSVRWYRDNRAWWEPLKASAATAHGTDQAEDATL